MKPQVSAFTSSDALKHSDATALLKALALKKVSQKELLYSAIARAEKVNPALNAIAYADFDKSIDEYKKSTNGVFAGIPSFGKDLAVFKGMPARFGSKCVPGHLRTKDDWMAKLFKSTGVNVIGKSTSSAFGFLPLVHTALHGATKNPYHIEYSSGGSSGGAAALVASGVVPIAHANDGGGSIRIPAAHCNLIGLKPSRGRDPKAMTRFLPVDVVSEGILSRSVRDTHLYLKGVEHYTKKPFLKQRSDKTYKIGLLLDTSNGHKVNDQVLKAVKKTAEVLAHEKHQIIPIDNPFKNINLEESFQLFFSFLAFFSLNLGRVSHGLSFDKKKAEPFTRGLSDYFWKHKFAFTSALKVLRSASAHYKALFNKVDLLLSPVWNTTVPKNNALGHHLSFEDNLSLLFAHLNFPVIQNIVGAPAVSLPVAFCDKGLPIGIQFAADLNAESTLLDIAYFLEERGHLTAAYDPDW